MNCSVRLRSRFSCLTDPTRADGPADNNGETVRQVPPVGAALLDADQTELTTGLAKLTANLDQLKQRKDARTQSLISDVEIYLRAIHDGLKYREFFPSDKPEVAAKIAKQVLVAGLERAEQLLKGEAPWLKQKKRSSYVSIPKRSLLKPN